MSLTRLYISEGSGPLFNDNTEPRTSHRTGFPFQGDSRAHRLGTGQQALVTEPLQPPIMEKAQ